MKLRPQFNLRFRDEDQFLSIKVRADRLGISVNELILQGVEKDERTDGNGKDVRGAGEVETGKTKRSGIDAAVSVLRNTKSKEVGLHPLSTGWDKLVGGGGLEQGPKANEEEFMYTQDRCAIAGHVAFKNGDTGWYCMTCVDRRKK